MLSPADCMPEEALFAALPAAWPMSRPMLAPASAMSDMPPPMPPSADIISPSPPSMPGPALPPAVEDLQPDPIANAAAAQSARGSSFPRNPVERMCVYLTKVNREHPVAGGGGYASTAKVFCSPRKGRPPAVVACRRMREDPPDDRPIASAASGEDARFDLTLRPRNFAEVVGQRALIDNLKVFVKAAAARREPLDHVLFCGPPGLGKTSLAHVIAHELAAQIHVTSGPALERKGDLAGILTNLAENDVLFIDEIHRMNPAIEENLYPAMETFTFDIVIGDGAGARALKLPLKPFTLIGATTRTGLLTGPLRDRFGIVSRLDFYPAEDLEEIVRRSAEKLSVRLDEGGAREIARRARGTPRIANRLLRRVRDFAEVEGDGRVTRAVADKALQRLEVDPAGLDAMDRKILTSLIDKFGGGPVGLETLASATGERSDTLEDVYEPYLLMEGYLARTPRGRVATQRGYEHLGRKAPAGLQGSLL